MRISNFYPQSYVKPDVIPIDIAKVLTLLLRELAWERLDARLCHRDHLVDLDHDHDQGESQYNKG